MSVTPRRRGCTHVRHGFTLIELLVVIAIIALLAAILFPVFARARENARRTSCQSNLKQVGLGIIQYTQDYDETYPGAYMTYGAPHPCNNRVSYAQLIYPYVKSSQIFRCPSASQAKLLTRSSGGNINNTACNPDLGGMPGISYGYNCVCDDQGLSSTNLGTNRYVGTTSANCDRANNAMSDVEEAATTVLLMDGNGQGTVAGGSSANEYNVWTGRQLHVTGTYTKKSGSTDTWDKGPSPAPANPAFPSQIHLETTNYLYYDGHVKAKKRLEPMELYIVK